MADLKTWCDKPLHGVDGKHVTIVHGSFPAGWVGGRHYHTGPVYVYVLDGSFTVDEQGKPRQTFTAGQLYEEPIGTPMQARNISTSEQLKVFSSRCTATGNRWRTGWSEPLPGRDRAGRVTRDVATIRPGASLRRASPRPADRVRLAPATGRPGGRQRARPSAPTGSSDIGIRPAALNFVHERLNVNLSPSWRLRVGQELLDLDLARDVARPVRRADAGRDAARREPPAGQGSQPRGCCPRQTARLLERGLGLCMRRSPSARAPAGRAGSQISSRERGRASNMPACSIISSQPVACPSVRVMNML